MSFHNANTSQSLSENKRGFLVPASTGSCMVARLWSQPITAQPFVVVLDGSLALQVINTCSGLETIVIDKLFLESFIEKRNNNDAFYRCCKDYTALYRPSAGYRLVSLVINSAEKFKGSLGSLRS